MYVANRLHKIDDGVYVNPSPVTEDDANDIENHYVKDALHVLSADVGHYAGLKATVLDGSPIDRHYDHVSDVAGGHPKLASCLDCDSVTVYDRQASDYATHHAAFLEAYPDSAPVEYVDADITDIDFAPSGDLAIFCHVIEHLTIQEGAELLCGTLAPRVLIYQPNIAMAQNEDWFHYAPRDHITFYTIDAMAKVLWFAGYKVEFGVEYHQDYLLYGVAR